MPHAFINLDLLSVGITVAAIGILGFVIFLNDKKSITNKAFLFFSIITIVWGVINYLAYQVESQNAVLWLLRVQISLAVLHVFSFFQLCYVFPKEHIQFSRTYKFFVIPFVVLTTLVNLTPLVFPAIAELSSSGSVSKTVVGNGIYLFVGVVVSLIVGGIYLMLKKLIHSQGTERKQYAFVLGGATITFVLLIVFNLILPGIFLNVTFIPLGAVFIFPFIIFTFYAIFRHKLLNVKVIATEILTFILSVVTLFEVIVSRDVWVITLRSGTFLLVLSFGILLIRSVRREVQQREELQELSQKLAAANGELQNLSQFKTQLLSLASHQIKSPLAAIKGFASILLEGLYGPIDPKVADVIGKMKTSANDLVELINSLLDLRKVEEGKMEYQFVKTDVVPLIAGIVDQLKVTAFEKKLELSFAPALSQAFTSADAQKLKQVFQNLIDNAIKYTPTGFVKVSLEQKENGYEFCVTDSGLGMPASLLPQLFEEFIRDARVKQQIRGTGLGLYIARKIIEAHGGRIWAKSQGEGKGSQFCVWVPGAK